MSDLNKTYLFRITHIENIPHILQYGITHVDSPNANPNFTPIGDGSMIDTRNNFLLDNGRNLGEYIPFYFGARTPMLYVIQKGYNFVHPVPAEKIVYCVSSVQKIIDQKLEFVFTDGHAIDSFSTQYNQNDVKDIGQLLDKKAIDARYWKDENDLDLKRRKEAEFLVLGDISTESILGYIVYNQIAKKRIFDFGSKPLNLQVRPHFYF